MGDKEKESVTGKGPGGHQYDAKSIKVLGGLEAVRLLPAMYIGSPGGVGVRPHFFSVAHSCRAWWPPCVCTGGCHRRRAARSAIARAGGARACARGVRCLSP